MPNRALDRENSKDHAWPQPPSLFVPMGREGFGLRRGGKRNWARSLSRAHGHAIGDAEDGLAERTDNDGTPLLATKGLR